ncbi:TPA: AAA family ATPase [Salmonella enterica]|nr:AAA family ATPase [Salmonella enterica]EFR8874890.1 AAA family ATPase [Salmonella enterica]EMA3751346.1 AAA family ATPase [Salmonella enterica]MBA3148792.1 AAA family ATPase [Salmonella enterica]HCL5273755.1 AAA family ATPase [Salmonella enterica]
MDELSGIQADLAQLVRLVLTEQYDDVRLYVARLVRKYRDTAPLLAEQLDLYLRNKPHRSAPALRKFSTAQGVPPVVPVDEDSRMNLLKVFDEQKNLEKPMLSQAIEDNLDQIILERKNVQKLNKLGLSPTKSAIFVGPPGVGKTMTAQWLAQKLNVPFYVLDLTAVMSSLLGKSGNNLRAALDFAKKSPCVLLLDEIDAIAKRRSDDADIGELKRLVTVILQEVDQWPSTGLLLAATNYADLIDPALWRRFDLVVEFQTPDRTAIHEAVKRFMGADFAIFAIWADILAMIFEGESFSDIERSINRIRRSIALGTASDAEIIEDFVKNKIEQMPRPKRIDMAVSLSKTKKLSQHVVSGLTGVSRDTIRKRLASA